MNTNLFLRDENQLASTLLGNIELLEQDMLKQEQVEMPVIHEVISGMHSRRLFIPKGTLLTGRVHKNPYVDIMLYGDISLATPAGVQRLQGTHVLQGEPGRKRAGYAHEDTLWMTVDNGFGAETEDEFLDQITFLSVAEYKQFRLEADKEDYKKIPSDINLTEDEIQKLTHFDNVQNFKGVDDVVEVRESELHGKGLFSKQVFFEGQFIAPVLVEETRTICGRYMNHSQTPNCCVGRLENGDLGLFALYDIGIGVELTNDYRDTFNVSMERIECPQQ